MKVSILLPSPSFSQKEGISIGTISHSYVQHSRFRETTRFFCLWLPDPLDPEADMLPPTAGKTVEEKCPLFAERISRFQPDIIEVHADQAYATYLAHALPDIPVVFYSHMADLPRRWHKRFNKAINQIAHIICVSDFAHQYFCAHHPKNKRKFSALHNALPTQGWLTTDSEKENIILFCARITRGKGIEQFIQAAAQIRNEFPDWRFVVLGRDRDVDYRAQQETIFKNAMEHQGQWIANVSREQVQTWNKKAQIGVVPSNCDEAFGLSLLEMHLASCAVISSGRGGMKEASGPDGALYLKEVSGDAIAQALRFLINNPQERAELARRGHEYVMRHHRIDDRAAELDRLRHQIIQRFKQEKGIWRRHVRYEQLRALKAKLFKAKLFG